jgi:CubicO group peptidase (beta-lactamase class C family)
MNKILFVVVMLVLLVSCSADVSVEISQSDEANFGDPNGILFWNYEEKVAGFRNINKLGQARVIPAGDSPYPLPKSDSELDAVSFEHGGETWTIDKYIEHHKVAGLIVVKDGSIILERYELGNTMESRWISFSVTKSVTSLLVGAALQDGYIQSVDEKITDYIPRLKNSPYEQSSIKNVLQMASGVAWDEIGHYANPEADINKVPWRTLDMYEYLRNKPRDSEPGEVFNYNTAETNLVGDVVRSAIGNNLSTYLSEKIWKPFGMEHDAYWAMVEPGGGEYGGSSLCATLRDYARLGLFVMNNGALADGTQILPETWIADSTAPCRAANSIGVEPPR